jgi:hypothetical protein
MYSSPALGNVMTGTCNCNFDMNMFLKNVENSVSRILSEKEMVYHQRLEEVENRLSNLATCLSVPSKDSGVKVSRTSGSGLEHVREYVGDEYAAEWSCDLEKVDNLSAAYSSIAMTSSVVECGGVQLMMEREGVVDGEEEPTAIMSGHHSFLEEIQRSREQVMQMEALVNEEDYCSWSGCEDDWLSPSHGWGGWRLGRFGRSHGIRPSSLNKLNRNSC